jgi:mono/diheme cytochrome c family protein
MSKGEDAMRSAVTALLGMALLVGSAAVTVPAQAKPDAAALKNPVTSTPDTIAKGKQAFNKACRHCHGPEGKGDGPLAPKDPTPADLTDARWDHGSSDGEIYTIIANGVGGDSKMKGAKSALSSTEMWQIVTFLRSIGPE